MTISVHQPHYLPWLGYFHKLAKSDAFVFLDCVQYKHREFQNRNKIRTSEGSIWLTVPVLVKGEHEQAVNEVLIDNEQDWQRKHWNSLQGSYGKAACFNEHKDFFQEVYGKQWERLIDLNLEISRYIINQLNINTSIHFESQIGTSQKATERIIEICKKLKADSYLSGVGGKDYLQEERFQQENIKLIYQDFGHPVYQQCFMKDDKDFLPYMSAIDLLFNEGEKGRVII